MTEFAPHFVIQPATSAIDKNDSPQTGKHWDFIAELYTEFLAISADAKRRNRPEIIHNWLYKSSDLAELAMFVPYKYMLNVVNQSDGKYGKGKWTREWLDSLAKVRSYNHANYINVTNIVTHTHDWSRLADNLSNYFDKNIPSTTELGISPEQVSKLTERLRQHMPSDTALIQLATHEWLEARSSQPLNLFQFSDKEPKLNIKRTEQALLTQMGKFQFLKPGHNKRQVIVWDRGTGQVLMHPVLYHNWHAVIVSGLDQVHEFINTKLRINNKHQICHFCCQPKDNQFDYYDGLCWDCGFRAWKIRCHPGRFDLSSPATYPPIRACVTGCRHTVGYFTVLELLRRGAEFVLGTTRFPAIALATYQQEPDYAEWSDRLMIIRADFLNWQDVSDMIAALDKHRINVYINNAFQTMPNSQEYLEYAARLEQDPESLAKLVPMLDHNRNIRPLAITDSTTTKPEPPSEMANMQIVSASVFDKNPSWKKPISQIAPQEIMTAGVVNSIVPEMVIGAFRRQCLARAAISPKNKNKKPKSGKPNNPAKFHAIINVGSSEGNGDVQASVTGGHKNHMQHVIRCLRLEQDPNMVSYTSDPGFITGIYGKTHDPRNPDSCLVKVLTSRDGAMRVLYPLLDYLAKGKPLEENYR
jgi:NAD(P)-dependent dehydrogenase (short-subunit alcohol dehydrogenase family)